MPFMAKAYHIEKQPCHYVVQKERGCCLNTGVYVILLNFFCKLEYIL